MGYPEPAEEIVILDEQKRTHPLDTLTEVMSADELRDLQAATREVYVDPAVSDYIVRLVGATRVHPDVYLGASPRGSIALYRASQAYAALLGRDYVIPDDVKELAESALAHRVIVKTSSTIRDIEPGQVVREVVDAVPVGIERPVSRVGGPRDIGDAGARRPLTGARPAPPPCCGSVVCRSSSSGRSSWSPPSRPGCRSCSSSSTWASSSSAGATSPRAWA